MTIDKTQLYINKFNYTHNKLSFSKLIHDHPTVIKTLQISATIFGILATISSLAFPPVALAIEIFGIAAILASVCSWLFFQNVICAKHDMKNHTFVEGSYGESRLYYRGDIPILELGGYQPRHWGEAHGRLLGAHIYQLRKNVELLLNPALPADKDLLNIIEQVKQHVPTQYLQELEGLSSGYNQWALAANIHDRMSVDDLIYFHLFPDSKHLHLKEMEQAINKKSSFLDKSQRILNPESTSILYKDSRRGMVFGRNMNCLPFGNNGAASVVVVWKEKKTAALTIPGLIGAITGWNQSKLCLAMNACPGSTEEVRGMPAIFYNRMLLDGLNAVDEVLLATEILKPLGPYHVTIADGQGHGKCISFYNDKENDSIREALPDKALVVLNSRYPEMQEGYFNNEKRHLILEDYFENGKGLDAHRLVVNALKITPFINSWITTHSVVFKPEAGKLSLNVDNGYVASGNYQEANISDFF